MAKPGILRFDTTALRAAYVITSSDIGGFAQDMTTGDIYMAMVEGASLDNWHKVSDGGSGEILLSLNDFREVTSGGDVGNIAANGGILASDTTPILRGDAAESQEIAWAAANADIIAAQIALPSDFDGSRDVTVDLWVLTDNAGGGGIEAATFTVETSWNGGTVVVDTATDTVPAVTGHKISATIAAADIPDTAQYVTLMLTPGTHANDPTALLAARINHKRV